MGENSLLVLSQGVVLSVLLEVSLQGFLLLLDVPGHLVVNIREEKLRLGLQFALGLLEGLHDLEKRSRTEEIEGRQRWKPRSLERRLQSGEPAMT